MKKLLVPILSIFLFVSCGKENINPQEEKASNQAIQSPNAFFELPQVQDYLNGISKSNHLNTQLQSVTSKNGNGAITSNTPIYNLAGTSCTDESGHLSITRTHMGAHFSYHGNGLTPGETYLIYVVVINNDEDCKVSSFDTITLGEKMANPAGNLNLNTFLTNGDNTNSWYGPFFSGMVNSYQADLLVFAKTGVPLIGPDAQISIHNVCSPIGCN